jgi:hypothetical protein
MPKQVRFKFVATDKAHEALTKKPRMKLSNLTVRLPFILDDSIPKETGIAQDESRRSNDDEEKTTEFKANPAVIYLDGQGEYETNYLDGKGDYQKNDDPYFYQNKPDDAEVDQYQIQEVQHQEDLDSQDDGGSQIHLPPMREAFLQGIESLAAETAQFTQSFEQGLNEMTNLIIGIDAVITEQKEAECEGVEYQKSLLVRLNDLSKILTD